MSQVQGPAAKQASASGRPVASSKKIEDARIPRPPEKISRLESAQAGIDLLSQLLKDNDAVRIDIAFDRYMLESEPATYTIEKKSGTLYLVGRGSRRFQPHQDDFFCVYGKPSKDAAGQILYIPFSWVTPKKDGGYKEGFIEFRDKLPVVKVEDLI